MPSRQNQAPATTGDAVTGDAAAAYWPVPLARGILAIAVGLAVTFTADHSPFVGLLALGALALTSGIVIAGLGRRRVADRTAARMLAAQGILSIAIGIAANGLAAGGAGLGSLLLVATLFAVLTGALELYTGFRTRTRGGRDWLTVGAGTLVFALVLLIAPTDSVTVVGFIGAYAVILGVYLVIAALSLKWAVSDDETGAPSSDPAPAQSTGATP